MLVKINIYDYLNYTFMHDLYQFLYTFNLFIERKYVKLVPAKQNLTKVVERVDYIFLFIRIKSYDN
jgi:hypothetical protein